MINVRLNKIFKYIILIIIILANITGILKFFLGTFWAEGILIIFTLFVMILLLIQKKRYNYLDILFIITAIYSILITSVFIIKGTLNIEVLLYSYSIFLPCLIFLNRNHTFFKKNSKFYLISLLFGVLINSLYAIYQVINPNAFIPIDGIRARGLMKSTLNYSGLLGCAFFPLLFVNIKSKIIKISSMLIIFIGGILSQSKGFLVNIFCGYLLSFPAYTILNNKIPKKNLKEIFGIFILIFIAISLFIYIIISMDLLDRFYQLFNILNFKTNDSNVGRFNAWKDFFSYFMCNPLGYGIGQIGSNIDTQVVENTVNFESYILDTLYEIGILGFVYFIIPIIWISKKIKYLKAYYKQVLLMFVIGIYLQNLVQVSMYTPTTLIMTWLNMIFFTNYLVSNYSKNKEGLNENNNS